MSADFLSKFSAEPTGVSGQKEQKPTALKVEQDPETLVEASENCLLYKTGQERIVRVPPSLMLDPGDEESRVPPVARASSMASLMSVSM